MDTKKRKEVKCCLCSKRPPYRSRRRVFGEELKRYVTTILKGTVSENEVICNGCHAKFHRKKKTIQSPASSSQHDSQPDVGNVGVDTRQTFKSQKSVTLNIKTTPRTHKVCAVCKNRASKRNTLIVFPSKARTQAFIETGIYIDEKNRCCKKHIDNAYLTADAISVLSSSKSSDVFSRTDITRLLHNVRTMMKCASKLNFDIPSLISDDGYYQLTGLHRDEFSELCDYLLNMRNTSVRSVRTTVAIFMTKMRTGLSNKLLGVMFGMKKSQVQRAIHSARESLMTDFVPKHLGMHHISHDDLCANHTTSAAKTLFRSSEDADEAVLILDGTYIYIQKSMDYLFQRKSYSLHKNRPLVKPMLVVGSDGYVLTVFGPYYANGKNNDAQITLHSLSTNSEDINNWLRPNDIFIVDRGFRDAIPFMEERGIHVHMPSFLPKGQKQHSVEEANTSRLVTKVRWVVESANGRLKQWRLLDKVMPNSLIPCIGDFVRIISAITNRFRPSLSTPNNAAEHTAKKMLEKSVGRNYTKEFLEENNLISKRSIYRSVADASDILETFSRLEMDELREITLGVYQLKQAPHYTKEHLSEGSEYSLGICTEHPTLLKVKIQSRHTNSHLHNAWIDFSPSSTGEKIRGWYCTCKVGARVVGCFAHVASILWYFGLGRYQNKSTGCRDMCSSSKLLDAAHLPVTEVVSDPVEE